MPEFLTTYIAPDADKRPVYGQKMVISGPEDAGGIDYVDYTRFFSVIGVPENIRAELQSDLRAQDAITAVAIQNTRHPSTPILTLISGQVTNTDHPKQLEITFLGVDNSKATPGDIQMTLDAIHSQARENGCTKVVCTGIPESVDSMTSVLAGYTKTDVSSGAVFEKEL